MFNIEKFGLNMARLRKEKNLTQSDVAEILNVTRQAVSKWEKGETFPNITLLNSIAELYDINLENLIKSANLNKHEMNIISEIAKSPPDEIAEMLLKNKLSSEDILSVAPYLESSVFSIIIAGYEKKGIDISYLQKLSQFINDESIKSLLVDTGFSMFDEELLEKLIPFLNMDTIEMIFSKIIDGELSPKLIKVIKEHVNNYNLDSQIEAAVIAGVIPDEYLRHIN